MSSSYSKKYKFDTSDYDPLGQDKPGSHQQEGHLWFHHTSDIVTWVTVDANGLETYSGWSNPEYDALYEAMTEGLREDLQKARKEAADITVKLGEYQNKLHEARQELARALETIKLSGTIP